MTTTERYVRARSGKKNGPNEMTRGAVLREKRHLREFLNSAIGPKPALILVLMRGIEPPTY